MWMENMSKIYRLLFFLHSSRSGCIMLEKLKLMGLEGSAIKSLFSYENKFYIR